ncbi:MAG: SIS domain-containing protein [bacterium]|nr:SIS domain-containing protein [bacterium]
MSDFLHEIREQPAAVKATLDYLLSGGIDDAFIRDWRSAETVIFTGMGSSCFAPLTAMNLMAAYERRAFVLDASELLHYNMGIIRSGDLPVLISQSGESVETVKLLDLMREKTGRIVSLTNTGDSTLAAGSDHLLLTRAGNEEMTSSKTYVSTIMLLLLIVHIGNGDLPETVRKAVYDIPGKLDEIINSSQETARRILDYMGMPQHLELISRGPSMATARQGALVLKEASGTLTEAMNGGEFRHGPMEAVNSDFKAVIFAPSGPSYALNAGMAEDIAGFGGKVAFVTSSGKALNDKRIMNIEIPEDDPYLFTMLDIQVIDFLAMEIAREKGFKAGSFTHGAKVTTKE